MDKPQLEVLLINSTSSAGEELQPKVALAHSVARPGTPLGRLISEPFDHAVDALKAPRNREVVFTLEEGVGVGVGKVYGDGFPWEVSEICEWMGVGMRGVVQSGPRAGERRSERTCVTSKGRRVS